MKHQISTEDLQEAETEIINSVQREEFQEEISLLCTSKNQNDAQDRASFRVMKKKSSLYKLDPFLDHQGVLRVGGRLKYANLTASEKHPVILPKRSHVTNLVVSHYHEVVKHQGRGITHNQVRSAGFWIIGGSSIISEYIAKCVVSHKLRGPVVEQKMADLPQDLVQSAPPFTYCAVDYFGPWYVKEGRREVKRYGVLYTCMASRAIHI